MTPLSKELEEVIQYLNSCAINENVLKTVLAALQVMKKMVEDDDYKDNYWINKFAEFQKEAQT